MKSNKDNRYFQYGINGLLVVCGGIFFYYILFHSDKLSGLISSITSILTPFIAGFLIAYILNPVMMFLEDRVIYKLLKRNKKINTDSLKIKKCVRFFTTFVSVALFIALLYSLIIMIVPQIIINIQTIIDRIPMYFINVSSYYNSVLQKYPNIERLINQYMVDISEWVYNTVIPFVESSISQVSSSILGSIITVFKSVLNFIIGIIISLYLLLDKEKFLAQGKKIIYAMYNENRANNFINNIRYADKIFGGFFTGKVVDSIIIGIICYICMLILKLPYAALISVVIGITNIIPYFGPVIGAIPTAFIVLLVDPKKCLIFLIFVLILQQFDGNILGPKILGSSTGLSSFWVIFAITVFSGIFGVIGMFIGVPLFGVIYAAIKTFVNERLYKKNMPVTTKFYKDNDFIIDDNSDVKNDGTSFRFIKDTFAGIDQVISDEEKVRRGYMVGSIISDEDYRDSDDISEDENDMDISDVTDSDISDVAENATNNEDSEK